MKLICNTPNLKICYMCCKAQLHDTTSVNYSLSKSVTVSFVQRFLETKQLSFLKE